MSLFYNKLRFCQLFNSDRILQSQSSRTLTQDVSSHLKIAGTGNPYATELKRKRQVKNISYPDFEKQESLKWSKWSMLRDVKRRILNSDYWQYRMNLQNISASRALPNVVKDMASEERSQTPYDSSINHIVNRCAITSRSRGRLTTFRMSRIVWREQADAANISGFIRAKWG